MDNLSPNTITSEISPQENVSEQPILTEPVVPDEISIESLEPAADSASVVEASSEEPSSDAILAEQDALEEKLSVPELPKPELNLDEIKIMLMQLAKDFVAKLKYDAAKQEQIDKLYNENQKFKDGIIQKFQTSMVLAVIEQIDDAAKQIGFFENAEFSETNFQKVLKSYRDIATSFQDVLLEKFDVSTYCCELETPFEPKRQRSLKTAKTGDIEKNKLVKASLRPGYEKTDGTVLRPELVEVYVYDSTVTPTMTPEQSAENL